MLSITYVSTALQEFSEADLLDLLAKSRVANVKFAITGLLLYKDGNFMQAIEGPADAIKQLHKNIQADPRHRNIITLVQTEVSERAFPEWHMAFQNLQGLKTEDMPGYSKFLEPRTFSAFSADPTQAQKLLLMFREKMR